MKSTRQLVGLSVVVFAFAIMIGTGRIGAQNPSGTAQLTPTLIKAEELTKLIRSQGKPLVLNVGPRFLYAQGHIPGAEYIGPPNDPRSLEKLRQRVQALPRSAAIVIYCGCCPWEHCPNVRPAYKELRSLGFTNTKVLYIANSFGTDWVEKGYPVAKGE